MRAVLRRRGGDWGRTLQPVDLLDQDEHSKGDDHESDDVVDELPVGDHRDAFGLRVGE